jgi:chorismate dehydratase
MSDVRSIAMDTSSRTSVALVRVLCARHYRIQPRMEALGPDLPAMLKRCDAALIIGDNALFLNPDDATVSDGRSPVTKMDLGQAWTELTGLPFVYAFWAGRPHAVTDDDVAALQQARDEGVKRPDELARAYFADRPERHEAGARYLRDNVTYSLGDEDLAGLTAFYRYAAEAGVVDGWAVPRFFGQV